MSLMSDKFVVMINVICNIFRYDIVPVKSVCQFICHSTSCQLSELPAMPFCHYPSTHSDQAIISFSIIACNHIYSDHIMQSYLFRSYHAITSLLIKSCNHISFYHIFSEIISCNHNYSDHTMQSYLSKNISFISSKKAFNHFQN
jgi:hypothetical protein